MDDRTAAVPVSRREFYSALSTVFSSVLLAFVAVAFIRRPWFDAIVVLQLLVCDWYYLTKSRRQPSDEAARSPA